MGLDERLTRLERDEGGEPEWEPLPREHVHALDVLASLKRERFYDDSTPVGEIEKMLVARGVDEPLACEFAEMMVELRKERLKGWA